MSVAKADNFQLFLLGRFEIERGADHLPAAGWKRRKAAALLQRLALEQRLPKEIAIDFLWPEASLASGSNNLYRTIYALREVLNETFGPEADAAFFSFAGGVLYLNEAVWVDAVAFRELAGGPTPTAADRQQAHALYQGDLLPADPYSDWLIPPREALRRLHRENSLALATHFEAEGDYRQAIPLLTPFVAADPLDELVHRRLMRLYALSEQTAAAIRQYQLCVEALQEELGVEPEAETEALYEAIRTKQFAIPAAKEKTVVTPTAVPARHNLPAYPTPFIGRTKEVAEVRQLLQAEPPVRLVTLLGPGGIGKTRLGLAIASAMADTYAHGVSFVPLAPLKAAEHVTPAVAENVGLRFFGAEAPEEQLLDFLQNKRMLLVMDNFEHILGGAALVAQILQRAPGVQVLVTSRERLNLSGEAVYSVGGLPFPPGDATSAAGKAPAAGEYPAMQLLLQHARRAQPQLAVAADEMQHAVRICQLVEGMPLALVLAAGWLEMLSFAEIAGELSHNLDILETEMHDVPARQRSVRAAFDGSWQRLSPAEQDVFMKLSVFRGGFTREAAQQVAGATLPRLRALVHKSFVTVDEDRRYQIHELTRQYGEERLQASGGASAAQTVHSDHFLDFLYRREADLRGRRQLPSLREIEADFENVRAAWLWAVAHDNQQAINRALESLHLFCDMQARYREGIALLQTALDELSLADADRGNLLRARLLVRLRFMQVFAPDANILDMRADIADSLAIAEDEEDLAEVAFARFAQAGFELNLGDGAAFARSLLEQSVAAYERLGDRFYQSRVLIYIGLCSISQSDPHGFFKYTQQGLELSRSIGAITDMAVALANLTEVSILAGDVAAARQYGAEAIELAGQTGLDVVAAQVRILLAFERFLQGDLTQSGELVRVGLQQAEERQYALTIAYAAALRGILTGLQGDAAQSRRLGEESLSIPLNNTLGIVLAYWALAIAHCHDETPSAAWRALADAFAQADLIGAPAMKRWLLPIAACLLDREGQQARAVALIALATADPLQIASWWTQWPLLRDRQATLEQELGTESYQRAWEEGQALDLAATLASLASEFGSHE
jgi:predicted ATPase/DNA-binding SARP family transcriptional activator